MQKHISKQNIAKQHFSTQDFAKKCALVAFNVAFVAISMCYPLGLYFGGNLGVLAGVMTITWGIKAFLGVKTQSGFWVLNVMFSLMFLLLFLKECFSFDGFSAQIAYFYPTTVYILLLAVFSISLRGEAIITRFALLSHRAKSVDDLPKEVQSYLVPYTRTLTKIWACYFVLCGIVSIVLASLEDKFYWSVFCGGICYVALGLLFGVEWLYRMLYFIPKHRNKN